MPTATARKANVSARVFNLLLSRIAPCKIPFPEQTHSRMTDESCHMDGKIRLSRSDSAETLLLQEANSPLSPLPARKLSETSCLPFDPTDFWCQLRVRKLLRLDNDSRRPGVRDYSRSRKLYTRFRLEYRCFRSIVITETAGRLCEREIRIRQSGWLILSFGIANEFIFTHVYAMNYTLHHTSHRTGTLARTLRAIRDVNEERKFIQPDLAWIIQVTSA